MAAETGRILTGFGIDNEDAANATNTLATRAADMAAIVGRHYRGCHGGYR